MNFPHAVEILFKNELESLKLKMFQNSWKGYIDSPIMNRQFHEYLESKGFEVREIRYETIDGKYGYHGKARGDGCCMVRIIWGNVNTCLSDTDS